MISFLIGLLSYSQDLGTIYMKILIFYQNVLFRLLIIILENKHFLWDEIIEDACINQLKYLMKLSIYPFKDSTAD